MPDLIVHVSAGYLAGRASALPPPAAVAGALIPDLMRSLGVVSDGAWPYTGRLHEPIPVLIACVLASRFFAPAWRRRALAALALGAFGHLLLDLLQDHLGWGYFPLFPFSRLRFEWGVLPPEGHFWAGPALLALSLALGRLFPAAPGPSRT